MYPPEQHSWSGLPSPLISMTPGDSQSAVSKMTCRCQCPSRRLGFSYQEASFPGNPYTSTSSQPSRLKSYANTIKLSEYALCTPNPPSKPEMVSSVPSAFFNLKLAFAGKISWRYSKFGPSYQNGPETMSGLPS